MRCIRGRMSYCALLTGVLFLAGSLVFAGEAGQSATALNAQPAQPVVTTQGRFAPAIPRIEKPLLLPPSVEYGLPQLRSNYAVSLPPLDTAALLEEDRANSEGLDCEHKRLRIGVARDIAVTDASGVWQSVPQVGYVWSAVIESAGAFQTRLHFSDVSLPEGARLWAYSTDDSYENWHHFEGAGPLNDGQFWTPESTGQTVYLEYTVPFDAVPDGQLPEVGFIVDSLQHEYRELTPLLDDGLRDVSCMADSACYSPWDTVRNAVARITFVEPPYSYLCTGQLVDTVAGDYTPYFNTANHCISTSTVAHTMTAYFYNQRSTCGGAFNTQYASSYAELVSTLNTSDGTLLLIKGRLYYDTAPTMYWTGWTTAVPSNGTDIVCIHHPEGSWKRISFGDKTGSYIVNGNIRSYQTVWYAPPDGGSISVTAGGSSGSGLWLASSQLLVGQLCCGSSYCSTPTAPDYYGRFVWSYNYASGWSTALQAGPDDDLEDNDTCTAAVQIGSGTYSSRVVKNVDEDWYKFYLTPCQSVSASLTFTDSWGDVDLRIYNGCGGSVVASSLTNTNNESLVYTPTTAGWYYMRVNLDDDTRNEYGMQVSIYDNGASPPAGSCDFNCDGHVKYDDYVDFAACMTGPDGGPLAGTCDIADTDSDNDVDVQDFETFQQLYGN